MKNRTSIFSFFAGSGFLDLGFEINGYNISFVNEIHNPFLKAYKYSRKLMNIDGPEYGFSNCDISEYLSDKKSLFLRETVNAQKKKGIVGFIGGPPCPDFSVGGKNKGRNGINGKLSGTYIELITKCSPDFFLFENVKGLWRTQKHRAFFEELKKKLQDNGYYTTEKLINSIEYGAPQDRDRIILLGFHEHLLKDIGIRLDGAKSLPADMFPWKDTKYKKEQVFNMSWPKTTVFAVNSSLPAPNDVPKELTVQYWFEKNDVENHSNSQHCFQPKAGIVKFAQIAEGDDSRKSFKRLHRWRYSPTACYGNNEVHLHPYKIRRINVAEALAIQTLPPIFVLPDDMSLTDMFKTVGNGVPYLAAKGVANSIELFLERRK